MKERIYSVRTFRSGLGIRDLLALCSLSKDKSGQLLLRVAELCLPNIMHNHPNLGTSEDLHGDYHLLN